MNWTAETVRSETDNLFNTAREMRRHGDEVQPIVFLFISSVDPLPMTIAMAMDEKSKNKEEHRQFITNCVAKSGAQFVARVDEAWMVQEALDEHGGDGESTALAAVKSGKSLKNFPGRMEVIHMVVDGPGMALMYWCDIHSDGTLGETHIENTGTKRAATGRFTNLSGQLGEN